MITKTVLPMKLHSSGVHHTDTAEIPAGTRQIRLTFAAEDWPTEGGEVLLYELVLSEDGGNIWRNLASATLVAGVHPITGEKVRGPDLLLTYDPPLRVAALAKCVLSLRVQLTTHVIISAN